MNRNLFCSDSPQMAFSENYSGTPGFGGAGLPTMRLGDYDSGTTSRTNKLRLLS